MFGNVYVARLRHVCSVFTSTVYAHECHLSVLLYRLNKPDDLRQNSDTCEYSVAFHVLRNKHFAAERM
jgi:hypothetical protein